MNAGAADANCSRTASASAGRLVFGVAHLARRPGSAAPASSSGSSACCSAGRCSSGVVATRAMRPRPSPSCKELAVHLADRRSSRGPGPVGDVPRRRLRRLRPAAACGAANSRRSQASNARVKRPGSHTESRSSSVASASRSRGASGPAAGRRAAAPRPAAGAAPTALSTTSISGGNAGRQQRAAGSCRFRPCWSSCGGWLVGVGRATGSSAGTPSSSTTYASGMTIMYIASSRTRPSRSNSGRVASDQQVERQQLADAPARRSTSSPATTISTPSHWRIERQRAGPRAQAFQPPQGQRRAG